MSNQLKTEVLNKRINERKAMPVDSKFVNVKNSVKEVQKIFTQLGSEPTNMTLKYFDEDDVYMLYMAYKADNIDITKTDLDIIFKIIDELNTSDKDKQRFFLKFTLGSTVLIGIPSKENPIIKK